MRARRETLADMLYGLPDSSFPMVRGIQDALRDSMSEDDWESDAATDLLNTNTDTDSQWIWEAGDLLLIETPKDELEDIAKMNGK